MDKLTPSKTEKSNNVLLTKNNKANTNSSANQSNINQLDTRDYLDKNVNEHMNINKSETPDIFNKLYVDSYRKQNKILLNEEIKKLSEIGSCTFKPTIRKYNFDDN